MTAKAPATPADNAGMADSPKGSQDDPSAAPSPRVEGEPEDSPFSVQSSKTYLPGPRARRGTPGAPLALLGLILPVGLFLGWLAGRTPKPSKGRPPVAVAVEPDARPPLADSPMEVPEPPVADRNAVRSNWTTVDHAEEASRRTGKPILLDFNAAWSPACRDMKREVFDDAALGEVVRRAVVPVSVVDRSRESDSNSPEIEALLQNYSIESFPTLVVYMPGTGRTMRMRGYGNANQTARWIQDAAEAVR